MTARVVFNDAVVFANKGAVRAAYLCSQCLSAMFVDYSLQPTTPPDRTVTVGQLVVRKRRWVHATWGSPLSGTTEPSQARAPTSAGGGWERSRIPARRLHTAARLHPAARGRDL